jgi:hypothetical protein
MPYQGTLTKEGTHRFGIFDGKKLSPSAFLDIADKLAVDYDTLTETSPPTNEVFEELLSGAPPCLQALAQRGGVPKGSRNNGLFNFGIYLRKRYGEGGWEQHLDRYNQEFIDPPLGHKEVSHLVKAVNKKTYEYRCQDPPIADVCNRQICLSREFGIQGGDGDPGVALGPLLKLKTDPVTWIWDVNGARIALQTAELKDQGRFHTRAIEELNIWPNRIKPQEWSTLVRAALEECEEMDVPDDAKPIGQMLYYLEEYCTSGKHTRARSKEDLLSRKPWTNYEEGRVYFHGPDFLRYLKKQGFSINSRNLWLWLREQGAEPIFMNIKGKGINLWSIPAFDEQKEAFTIPVIANEDEL